MQVSVTIVIVTMVNVTMVVMVTPSVRHYISDLLPRPSLYREVREDAG